MKTIAQTLREAADLIEPEGAWTQEVFARNLAGQCTGLSEFRGRAVCWCMMGATEKVSDDNLRTSLGVDDLLEELIGDVAAWNDAPERTQAEVVAKLREAAALAEERGL